MSLKLLKDTLSNSLKMESELYEMVVDALKVIFKDDEKRCRYAISRFKESYEMFDYQGCMDSMDFIVERSREAFSGEYTAVCGVASPQG